MCISSNTNKKFQSSVTTIDPEIRELIITKLKIKRVCCQSPWDTLNMSQFLDSETITKAQIKKIVFKWHKIAGMIGEHA